MERRFSANFRFSEIARYIMQDKVKGAATRERRVLGSARVTRYVGWVDLLILIQYMIMYDESHGARALIYMGKLKRCASLL